MTILEQAAEFIDDELLNEGFFKTAGYGYRAGYTDRFFNILDRSAKEILNLKWDSNKNAKNIDVIRCQYALLKKEYERNTFCHNKFINGLMQVFDIIMENLESGDTDYAYSAKWPSMYNWFKDNADRINSNSENELVLQKLAGEYMTKIALPALQKFKAAEGKKQRKSARLNVKALLDNPEFQELLRTKSEGRFDIVNKQGSRPPVIVDNEKKLILNFRNYEELNDILVAKDESELYNVVKNQFDSPTGIYSEITETEIPEGIEFQYQNDALVACDWAMKDTVINQTLQRGTYYLSDKKTVVLFVNNGESLKSEFDVGEEESRYINEFANHNSELYVALNRNDKFNKLYTNPSVKFDVFEIVQEDNSQKYISRGTYMLDTIEDERIKYIRESDSITRMSGMSESLLLRRANYLLI